MADNSFDVGKKLSLRNKKKNLRYIYDHISHYEKYRF